MGISLDFETTIAIKNDTPENYNITKRMKGYTGAEFIGKLDESEQLHALILQIVRELGEAVYNPSDANLLLVEPNDNDYSLLERNLKRVGYNVDRASSSLEALASIRSNSNSDKRYSLILSEIDLPGYDGFHLIERISEDEKLNQIPFVFLTSKIEDKTIFEAWSKGCSAYLTKPLAPAEVILFVNRILNSCYKGNAELV